MHRIDADGEKVVEPGNVLMIAAQFVGDKPFGLAVVHPRSEVHGLVVEEDPELGVFGHGIAFAWHLLNEPACGGSKPVDFFIQLSVEAQRCRQADSPHRDLSLFVSRDGRIAQERRSRIL